MDIHFSCNKCDQNLVIDDAGAGLTIPCPKCGYALIVPPKVITTEIELHNATNPAAVAQPIAIHGIASSSGTPLTQLTKYENSFGLKLQPQDLPWQSYQNLIGDIGERFAGQWLNENGFEIYPDIGPRSIGQNLLGSKEQRRLPLQLQCPALRELADVCNKTLTCKTENTPCQSHPDEFFAINENPIAINLGRHVMTNLGPLTGDNKFRHYCANKLTFLATIGTCTDVCALQNCLAKTVLQIEWYFHALWGEQNYYPCIKEWCKKWTGHPGGLDVYATKAETLYALDVKTGTGRLSNWQALRLAWLTKHGFSGGVIRVQLEIADKPGLMKLHQAFDQEFGFSSGADLKAGSDRNAKNELYAKRRAAMTTVMRQAFEMCRALHIEVEEFNPENHRASKFLPTTEQLQDAIRLSHKYNGCYGLPQLISNAEERDCLFLSLPMPTK